MYAATREEVAGSRGGRGVRGTKGGAHCCQWAPEERIIIRQDEALLIGSSPAKAVAGGLTVELGLEFAER